jgi:hypothetical protein
LALSAPKTALDIRVVSARATAQVELRSSIMSLPAGFSIRFLSLEAIGGTIHGPCGR